jgi:hypothetical protein
MKIFIKNMVCQGTRSFVIKELEELGISYRTFKSGVIDLVEDLSKSDRIKLDESMQQYGLELKFSESDVLSRFRHAFLSRQQ